MDTRERGVRLVRATCTNPSKLRFLQIWTSPFVRRTPVRGILSVRWNDQDISTIVNRYFVGSRFDSVSMQVCAGIQWTQLRYCRFVQCYFLEALFCLCLIDVKRFQWVTRVQHTLRAELERVRYVDHQLTFISNHQSQNDATEARGYSCACPTAYHGGKDCSSQLPIMRHITIQDNIYPLSGCCSRWVILEMNIPAYHYCNTDSDCFYGAACQVGISIYSSSNRSLFRTTIHASVRIPKCTGERAAPVSSISTLLQTSVSVR